MRVAKQPLVASTLAQLSVSPQSAFAPTAVGVSLGNQALAIPAANSECAFDDMRNDGKAAIGEGDMGAGELEQGDLGDLHTDQQRVDGGADPASAGILIRVRDARAVVAQVAEAVPELVQDRWQTDYESPQSEDLVRADARLAAVARNASIAFLRSRRRRS